MLGEDEDRLDFGEEDEELEDQISLGDVEGEGQWSGSHQQPAPAQNQQIEVGNVIGNNGQGSTATSQAAVLQAELKNDEEPPLPPGWVTRISRQGEMYYLHEPTKTSTWDRPTEEPQPPVEPEEVPVEANPVSTSVPVPAVAAANTVQDTLGHSADTNGTSTSYAGWGRKPQPEQIHAFGGRTSVTRDHALSSDRDARSRDIAPIATSSRSPALVTSQVSEASGKSSSKVTSLRLVEEPSRKPEVPTGPQTSRPLPTGPRSQQSGYRSSAPSPGVTTSGAHKPYTADRTHFQASGRPTASPASRAEPSIAPLPRSSGSQTRGDSGWPLRHNEARSASTAERVLPRRNIDTERIPRSREEDDSRPSSRTATASGALKDDRYTRDAEKRKQVADVGAARDQGWPARSDLHRAPSGSRLGTSTRRDPSPPPRKAHSPPPQASRNDTHRDDPRGLTGRPRSPLPLPARPSSTRQPEGPARRAARSPSPPRMRQWAVRAPSPISSRSEASKPVDKQSTTGSQASALQQDAAKAPSETLPNTSKATHIPSATSQKPAKHVSSEAANQGARPSTDANASATASTSLAFPRPPRDREISPSLASRLDRPLSDMSVQDVRKRRPASPPLSRQGRRSPSPPRRDYLRKTENRSLNDRVIADRPSLLQRIHSQAAEENHKNSNRSIVLEDRPPKRSKVENAIDSILSKKGMGMEVDLPIDLSRRLSRQSSRSPPPTSGGISIFGASKASESGANIDSEKTWNPHGNVNVNDKKRTSEDRTATQEPLIRLYDPDTGRSFDARTLLATSSSSAALESSRSPKPTPAASKDKDSRDAHQSDKPNGDSIPSARPSGFAGLPPKPMVVAPLPDNRHAPRGGASTSNAVLLDSYRPGPPPRRPDSRGPPASDTYSRPAPKDVDRYIPRNQNSMPPSRPPPPRTRSPPRDPYRR